MSQLRLHLFLGLMSCLLIFPHFSFVSRTYAQDAPEAAAQPAENPAPEAAAGAQDAPPAKKKNMLFWIAETSGWIGGLLLLISIYFVALITKLFVDLQAEKIVPSELMQKLNDLLGKKDYQGIYNTAKADDSETGQLIAAGMQSLSSGISESRESIDRLGEVITVDMEKRISMLAVIGSLGPMIGLLGTLKGMIASFSVIAMSETQLKASEVAGGISEALLVTFEGVALSVPAIFFFAVFKNRVSVLTVQAMTISEDFVRRVYLASRAKPTAE